MNNCLFGLALATTSSDHQPENRQLTPLSKWQIQRCSSPNPGYCQEEMVNDWLHRNHIRVVQRLPKMDPFVLVSHLQAQLPHSSLLGNGNLFTGCTWPVSIMLGNFSATFGVWSNFFAVLPTSSKVRLSEQFLSKLQVYSTYQARN